MSDADEEIERIREQKLEELAEQASSATSTGEPVHIDSVSSFRNRVETERVILVDFYADWCGPCQMLEPTVNSVAAQTDATVLKVDIDEHQSLAQQYGVRGVPTLLLFVDGEVTERLVGVQDEETLLELVEYA